MIIHVAYVSFVVFSFPSPPTLNNTKLAGDNDGLVKYQPCELNIIQFMRIVHTAINLWGLNRSLANINLCP